MLLENFQNSFEKQKNSKKLFNKILCLAVICVSFFLIYSVFVNIKSKGLLFLAFWLMILGTYGLFELRKHYKLTYFENDFSGRDTL